LQIPDNDGLAKNRHSRLSGIILPHTMQIKYDSGQAGMTVPRRFSAFYETITNDQFPIPQRPDLALETWKLFGILLFVIWSSR
jgi:hypothetical protein